MTTKPTVTLTNHDGNAFAILATCRRAMLKANWAPERVAAVLAEMKSGDYDHLLTVACTHFDIR
jgi:hypothetical protein